MTTFEELRDQVQRVVESLYTIGRIQDESLEQPKMYSIFVKDEVDITVWDPKITNKDDPYVVNLYMDGRLVEDLVHHAQLPVTDEQLVEILNVERIEMLVAVYTVRGIA